MFENGLTWVKADFHLHTHKDKEFKYSGEENSFVKEYIAQLKSESVSVGVITNHNKFDEGEYKALKKSGRKEGILILPGVELSVKEANGIHTLIVFNPDEWIVNGENFIAHFLIEAFAGISNAENRNTRCKFDLRNVIEDLDSYGKDYFIVFAHVDQGSGLMQECSGGLLESFRDLLKNAFRGSNLKDAKRQILSENFPDFLALIDDIILDDGKKCKAILSENEYGKVKEKIISQYGELIRKVTPNKVEIKYHGKLLKQHSLGQRASALVLFILTKSENDVIIIDQPEDDLDNKVIYDEVIKAIRDKKTDIQFLFATHNANIPVLGDAEKIVAAEYSEGKIIPIQGNIDSPATHKLIVDIMEGGQEAFERRQMIYTAWN